MKKGKSLKGIPLGIILLISLIGLHGPVNAQVTPPATTIDDFFLPGSQPLESGGFIKSSNCNCHDWTSSEPREVPYFNWQGSMMAQAARDPLYLACMAISNQDAPEVGDLCIRCHAPVGWLEGRSEPTDGSALTNDDKDGVQCHFCHKLVKPSVVGENPFPGDPGYNAPTGNNNSGPSTYDLDQAYLNVMTSIPTHSANGMYIVEDDDKNRRGPFSDSDAKHDNPYSPFHSESNICGTCHDVSNPAFSAEKDAEGNFTGLYMLNALGEPAPDFASSELFPVERTFSEWTMSDYNTEQGVYAPQFAGSKVDGFVASCQDCHMKDLTGYGANNTSILRNNLPHHDMTGGNTFMPSIIATLFPGDFDDELNAGIDRARYMLQNAASMNIAVDGQQVHVRVTNETGHKLPSGYPEGRRIWLNVKATNSATSDSYESGLYNFETADLEKTGTKIYEIKPGIGENIAGAVNLTAGPSFHFVLNNKIFFDNRIPPRGFANATFEEIQSPPVDYTYTDGQYWDDTYYDLGFEPDQVEVTLYYQTVSKEYVTFLRDENNSTDPNNPGQVMYNLWESHGKSTPEVMNHLLWTPGDQNLVWTGSVDSDWNNAGNWDQAMIPGMNTNVLIPSGVANYPVVSAAGSACNYLTMELGAELTVPEVVDLTVYADFKMEGSDAGIGSLLEYGNMRISGFAEVQFYMDESRWHYFSPPVANQVANPFYGMYLYSYFPENTEKPWYNIVDENARLKDGLGYKVWSMPANPGPKSVTFRGSGADLHNIVYRLPLENKGAFGDYDFVGNPYLSAIDWDHPSWEKVGIAASIYVWNGIQYLSWNGAVGDLTDGVIPAMQGFFVAVDGTTSNPSLLLKNDARVHGPDPYKNANGSIALQLHVEGNGYYDNTFIYFNKDATKAFDSDLDAFKIMGLSEAPQMYTRAGDDLARINVLPLTLTDCSVPVELITPEEDEYTLVISGQNNFNHYDEIYLEDKHAKEVIDLMVIPKYTFNAGPAGKKDRFVVHFKNSAPSNPKEDELYIYSHGSNIYLDDRDGIDLPEHAEVYDLAGNCLFSAQLEGSVKNVLIPNVQTGLYLVKVYTGSTIHSKKVFLK